METKPVQFTNRVDYRLAGLLDTPSDTTVRAWALFAHCFTCGKDLKPFANMNEALTARGIGVLRFDFSGLGESQGDFTSTDLGSNEADLLDAAAFLKENYEAPRLLIGHSLGGAAVIRAAKHLPSVRAVATIASPADPDHLGQKLSRARKEAQADGRAQVAIGGQRFTLQREFFEHLEESSLRDDIRELRRALLVLHSPKDESVEIDNAAKIFQLARHPKSFVSLRDADHLMLDKDDARYAGNVIAAWAEPYLES